MPELVSARATASPGSLAVVAENLRLTYGDLERRANRLASYLRSLGVGRDVLVGLCLPRSADLVIAALGTLKAGGAYVPLDPAYPPDRLGFMLDDAQAPALISTPNLAQSLSGANCALVCLDAPQLVAQPAELPPVDIAPGDLAYVIYTSGSTGKPKGVEITHASLANLVSWHNSAFAVTATDRASHLAGLGFDAAVWELWPYLVAGASVHLITEENRNSAEVLWDWLADQGITISFIPTPLTESLLTLDLERLGGSRLRVLLTGGDTLQHYPPSGLPFKVVNNYGPTECAVVATSGPVSPNGSSESLPPIGRAITNTDIYLLDDALQPVPAGTPGEIYVGGAGLARGYHNRPDLTAERFVPNPFRIGAGSRLYRTGDLGRLLPDGQIAFLGRTDDQIKIRGYRIEPQEVASVLNRHPAVRESLVLAREDRSGERRLVAYLLVHANSDLTHAGLRSFSEVFLPDYMIPATFVRLEAFPLTAHGKIDRKALPAPDPSNTLRDEISAGPSTPTEERVAGILGELLELDEIGPDDNFFMLGGHSLLGAQLIARLREALGVELTLRTLFEAATVAELSAEIDRLAGQQGTSEGTPSPTPLLHQVGV